ncbi:MAG: DMT family transporter [Deltaproteobacteria bacterium]|nr:DMT family transporter [Deltaproteobacteria bacterium]
MTKLRQAYLMLVLAGLAWGATPLLTAIARLDLLQLAFQRSLFSLLFLSLALLGRSKKILRIIKEDWKEQLAPGVYCAVSAITFVMACAKTSPAHVYLLYYMFPVYTLLIDCFSKRKLPEAFQLGLIAASILGLTLMIGSESSERNMLFGDLLAFASGLTYAGYINYGQRLKSDEHSLGAILIGLVIVLVPLGYLVIRSNHSLVSETWTQFGAMAIMGLLLSLALFGWGNAVRHVPGHIAAPVVMIEAPIGTLLMWAIMDQPITVVSLIGGVIVLTSATLLILKVR